VVQYIQQEKTGKIKNDFQKLKREKP